MSFTKAQRKHLQLRVAYGVVHETGLLLDNRAIKRKGLIVNLSADMNEALIAVGSTLLVRAGLIYVPIGWKNLDDDASIPLGIEWWLVDD